MNDTPISYNVLVSMIVDSQTTAQFLAGDDYENRVQPWRELIRALAKAHGRKWLNVAYTLLCDLDKADHLNGGAAMWVLAATADIIDKETGVKG